MFLITWNDKEIKSDIMHYDLFTLDQMQINLESPEYFNDEDLNVTVEYGE